MSYKKERIKYFDALKFIAIFGVIAIHTIALYPHAEILNVKIGNLHEIFRYCIPIFLMVSGALLLNRDIEIGTYIKKRFVRILLPIIFYIVIICILQVYTYKSPLNGFWFAWMILGTYLAVPIINKFIQNAKMKEIEYYLIIFVIASVFYQIVSILNKTQAIDLGFFIGPVSYLILGYYLSKKEFKISPNKIILISSIIFILIVLMNMKFNLAGVFYPTTSILATYLNLNIFVIIESCCIFLIAKNLYKSTGILSIGRIILENNIINKFINSVSRSTYGMYLLHMILIRGYIPKLIKGFKLTGTETMGLIIVLILIQFIITWIVTLIFGQIPYIKKVSGYA